MAKKKSSKKQTAPDGTRLLVRNRQAARDYHLHETVEAGIALLGSEVKSLRQSHASLGEAYVEIRRGEAWLVGATVKEYPWANRFNHEPARDRKLLLHKREIARLAVKIQQRGFTLVPLSMYLKNGRVKVELALAVGKRQFEKRDAVRDADAQREIDRYIKSARGRK